jgi:ketosteroid isomerase-like protein
MRMLTFVVVALACMGTTTGYAQETSAFAVASKIIALEHAWNRASEARDLTSLDKLLDDAFVYVEANGRLLTKSEALAHVKRSDVLQVLAESMEVHFHGNTAVVTGILRTKSMKRGRPSVQSGRFVDTWLFKKGRWVSIASLVTPIG